MNEILEFLKWLIESYPLVLPGIALVIGWAAIFGWPKGLLVNSESLTHYPEEVNYNSFPNGRKRDAPVFDFSSLTDMKTDNAFKIVIFALAVAVFAALFLLSPLSALLIGLIGIFCVVLARSAWKNDENAKKRK